MRGWALQKELLTPDLKASSSSGVSGLATKLLSLWAHGILSATLVQELAHLATLDGASHDEMAALAKAGNYGAHHGNCHRDIMTTFCKGLQIQSYEVEVACVDPKTSKESLEKAAMFLPHVLFGTLAKEYPNQFEQLFSVSSLQQFWAAAENTGDDRLIRHPMTSKRDWRTKTVPLFLHGDGVEFQTRDTLMVWSWGCLISLFSALDSHFLISVFPKSCTSPNTWGPLMKRLVWSFKALLVGRHPERDPDNNPITVGSPFFLAKGQQITPGGLHLVNPRRPRVLLKCVTFATLEYPTSLLGM